jgi:hypothetical protein
MVAVWHHRGSVAVAVVSVLAACGGSSGGRSSAVVPPPPVTVSVDRDRLFDITRTLALTIAATGA